MKVSSLFFSVFFVFFSSAFAMQVPTTVSGTIDEVFCGELDPFFDETCIVFAKDQVTGRKYGLVFDLDPWLDTFVPADKDATFLVGKTFKASLCDYVGDSDRIGSYKDFDKNYFYLDCYSENFSIQK